jgi:hypothetical protein
VSVLFAPRPFTGIFWGLEAVHSIVIAIICFVILAMTKNLQDLSEYKGLKAFRKTFLFFGIACVVKVLTRHLALSLFLYPGLLEMPELVISAGAALMIYTHLMAIFYLLYSIHWKNLEGNWKNKPLLMHISAALISIAVTFIAVSEVYLLMQVFLIAYGVGIIHSKANRKKSAVLGIYELLMVFWTLNVVDSLLPVKPIWQIVNYAASFTIFAVILYRVRRKIAAVKK